MSNKQIRKLVETYDNIESIYDIKPGDLIFPYNMVGLNRCDWKVPGKNEYEFKEVKSLAYNHIYIYIQKGTIT